MPVGLSLGLIGTILTVSIAASLRSKQTVETAHEAPVPDPFGLLTGGGHDHQQDER